MGTTIDGATRTNGMMPTDDTRTNVGDGVSGAPSLLRDSLNGLLASGDPGAAIAALAVAMGRSERKSNDAIRASAERLQEGEDNNQLDAMRSKANVALASGIVSGAATAASGACSAVSGLKSAKSELAGDKLNNLEKAADNRGAAAVLTQQKADFKVGATDARLAGDSISASAKLTTSLLDFSASRHDINATAHAHAASHAKNAVDDAREGMQDASKLLDKALEFYKEYTSTKDQTTAIASRRA